MTDEKNEDKGYVVRDRRRFTAEGESRPEVPDAEARSKAKAPPEPPPRREPPRGEPPRGEPPRGPAGPGAARVGETPSAAEARAAAAVRAEAKGAGQVDFASFVLSIATNAIMNLGGDAQDGRVPSGRINISVAAQHIDILAMLAEKTHGNLTPEENELLTSLLYDLRMHYLAIVQEMSEGSGGQRPAKR